MWAFLHNTSIRKEQVLFFPLPFIFLLSFTELCIILSVLMILFSGHWGQILERRKENEKADRLNVHGVAALRMQ
jgi:hypothetical protein